MFLLLLTSLFLTNAVTSGNATMLAGSPPFDVDHPMLHAWFEAGEGPCIACITDIDGDGSTNVIDLLAIIATWGPCKFCPEDFNEDGTVDVSDLLLVISNWGECE